MPNDQGLRTPGAMTNLGHSQRGETQETWLTVSPSSLFSEVGYFSLLLSLPLSIFLHAETNPSDP